MADLSEVVKVTQISEFRVHCCWRLRDASEQRQELNLGAGKMAQQ